MSTALPKYGIVIWQDAAAYTGKPPKKPRKKLIPTRAVGMLALVADGTLVIVHEYLPDEKGIQRRIEGSIIPMGWVQEIIPLTPPDETPKKVKGTDDPERPEKPAA